jgi:hypothetical protein
MVNCNQTESLKEECPASQPPIAQFDLSLIAHKHVQCLDNFSESLLALIAGMGMNSKLSNSRSGGVVSVRNSQHGRFVGDTTGLELEQCAVNYPTKSH